MGDPSLRDLFARRAARPLRVHAGGRIDAYRAFVGGLRHRPRAPAADRVQPLPLRREVPGVRGAAARSPICVGPRALPQHHPRRRERASCSATLPSWRPAIERALGRARAARGDRGRRRARGRPPSGSSARTRAIAWASTCRPPRALAFRWPAPPPRSPRAATGRRAPRGRGAARSRARATSRSAAASTETLLVRRAGPARSAPRGRPTRRAAASPRRRAASPALLRARSSCWARPRTNPTPVDRGARRAEELNPRSCNAPFLIGAHLRPRATPGQAAAAFERCRAIAPASAPRRHAWASWPRPRAGLEEACRLYEEAALRNSSFALPVARLADDRRCATGASTRRWACWSRACSTTPSCG